MYTVEFSNGMELDIGDCSTLFSSLVLVICVVDESSIGHKYICACSSSAAIKFEQNLDFPTFCTNGITDEKQPRFSVARRKLDSIDLFFQKLTYD